MNPLSDPIFSVVVPVHNKAPHLKRALGSVVQQDFSSLELLVINDASTDGGEKILKQFSDTRIRVFHRDKPGAGGYAARNLGIKKARGEWVAFLDADDKWLPGHLSRLVELSEIFPKARILGCGWYISDGYSDNINRYASHYRKTALLDAAEYVNVQAKGIDVLHTDVVAVKRQLLTAIGGFPLASPSCKRAGDGQTWLRCMLAGAKLGWRPEGGAIYYQNAVNMVTRSKHYKLDENCLITFLNEITSDEESIPSGLMRGLRRYRDSRVLSYLLQNVRTGGVTRGDLVLGLKHFRFDIRFVLLVLAWLFPWVGKGVFKVKERLTGIQSK